VWGHCAAGGSPLGIVEGELRPGTGRKKRRRPTRGRESGWRGCDTPSVEDGPTPAADADGATPSEPPPRKAPGEAVEEAKVRAPTRGNRRLEALLDAVNSDPQIGAWWYMAQVTSERLRMSDHSWVHVQVVLNIALRVLRLLVRGGVEPAMVTDHGMRHRDAEVVVAAGALLHDVGLSIHRADHEAYSLFLASGKLEELLEGIYEEPERTVVASEALHAIIGHRRRGEPYTLEASVVRAADALDMAQGRSRIPFEAGRMGIHSLSAAAIDEVVLSSGEERPVRVEIRMNNSAGIFQVDDLLGTKLRDTPLAEHVEVVAEIEGETEKRLLTSFRLSDT
jgi:metal-dependent HD superfamily phosphatase/phosphodiesterase